MPQVDTPPQASLFARKHAGPRRRWYQGLPSHLVERAARTDVASHRAGCQQHHPPATEAAASRIPPMPKVETALGGAIDLPMHTTPNSSPGTDTLAARIQQRRVALTPTLRLWRLELLRAGDSDAIAVAPERQTHLRYARNSLQLMATSQSARHSHPVKLEYVERVQSPASYRQLAAAYDNGRSIAANQHQERSHRLTSMLSVGKMSRMLSSFLERPSYLPAIT
jgi:hypothetical protein